MKGNYIVIDTWLYALIYLHFIYTTWIRIIRYILQVDSFSVNIY